mmetsp:Transcript_4197/g.10893  ORF Transcript_4197/g.10893 Transcript_4197/m.10893 type:complete len:139 (+) Transcript_4197:65-481(+)|eukprot:CAMPEP_0197180100 /NCGR_PEP_ID=MMETSP1423-20130617/4829_1 /TAXON_ID=476441 /ORGANISM="Pseudo-nitzschia heimii, Strain UNC1101" /LENGTH=138 /DNA_ID=CAMNT_0042630121 /DNA_START=131 /DNA_END=547 /DNA_ORIENTATION=-
MIARLLGALTAIEGCNTIGCLVVVPIVISCLHYHRYRLRQNKAAWATVADTIEPLFFDQTVVAGEEDGAAANIPHHHLGQLDESVDGFGFRGHDERHEDENDAEDDILEEELVEITLDLGRMEGNIRRFLSRMHRVII